MFTGRPGFGPCLDENGNDQEFGPIGDWEAGATNQVLYFTAKVGKKVKYPPTETGKKKRPITGLNERPEERQGDVFGPMKHGF